MQSTYNLAEILAESDDEDELLSLRVSSERPGIDAILADEDEDDFSAGHEFDLQSLQEASTERKSPFTIVRKKAEENTDKMSKQPPNEGDNSRSLQMRAARPERFPNHPSYVGPLTWRAALMLADSKMVIFTCTHSNTEPFPRPTRTYSFQSRMVSRNDKKSRPPRSNASSKERISKILLLANSSSDEDGSEEDFPEIQDTHDIGQPPKASAGTSDGPLKHPFDDGEYLSAITQILAEAGSSSDEDFEQSEVEGESNPSDHDEEQSEHPVPSEASQGQEDSVPVERRWVDFIQTRWERCFKAETKPSSLLLRAAQTELSVVVSGYSSAVSSLTSQRREDSPAACNATELIDVSIRNKHLQHLQRLSKSGSVTCVEVARKDLFTCVGTQKGVILIFDAFESLTTCLGNFNEEAFARGSVTSMDISADGESLVVGHSSGCVCMWDVNKQELVKQISVSNNQTRITRVNFLKQGKMSPFLSVDSKGKVMLHTPSKMLWTISISSDVVLQGRAGPLQSLSVLYPNNDAVLSSEKARATTSQSVGAAMQFLASANETSGNVASSRFMSIVANSLEVRPEWVAPLHPVAQYGLVAMTTSLNTVFIALFPESKSLFSIPHRHTLDSAKLKSGLPDHAKSASELHEIESDLLSRQRLAALHGFVRAPDWAPSLVCCLASHPPAVGAQENSSQRFSASADLFVRPSFAIGRGRVVEVFAIEHEPPPPYKMYDTFPQESLAAKRGGICVSFKGALTLRGSAKTALLGLVWLTPTLLVGLTAESSAESFSSCSAFTLRCIDAESLAETHSLDLSSLHPDFLSNVDLASDLSRMKLCLRPSFMPFANFPPPSSKRAPTLPPSCSVSLLANSGKLLRLKPLSLGDRVQLLAAHGRWMDALSLGIDLCSRTDYSTVSEKATLSARVRALFLEYLSISLPSGDSLDALQPSPVYPSMSKVNFLNKLACFCMDFACSIDRTDLLWSEVLPKFKKSKMAFSIASEGSSQDPAPEKVGEVAANIFLAALVPFVLRKRIHEVELAVLDSLLSYLISREERSIAENVVLTLPLASERSRGHHAGSKQVGLGREDIVRLSISCQLPLGLVRGYTECPEAEIDYVTPSVSLLCRGDFSSNSAEALTLLLILHRCIYGIDATSIARSILSRSALEEEFGATCKSCECTQTSWDTVQRAVRMQALSVLLLESSSSIPASMPSHARPTEHTTLAKEWPCLQALVNLDWQSTVGMLARAVLVDTDWLNVPEETQKADLAKKRAEQSEAPKKLPGNSPGAGKPLPEPILVRQASNAATEPQKQAARDVATPQSLDSVKKTFKSFFSGWSPSSPSSSTNATAPPCRSGSSSSSSSSTTAPSSPSLSPPISSSSSSSILVASVTPSADAHRRSSLIDHRLLSPLSRLPLPSPQTAVNAICFLLQDADLPSEEAAASVVHLLIRVLINRQLSWPSLSVSKATLERLLKYTCAAGGEYMEYLVLPQNSCSASRLAHFLTAISKDSGSADAETKTLNDKVDDIALRQDEQGSAFKGVDASPTAIKLADMAWEKEALLLRLFEAVMWDNLDNLSDAQSQSVWLPAHVTPLLFDPEIAVINCKKAGYYQACAFISKVQRRPLAVVEFTLKAALQRRQGGDVVTASKLVTSIAGFVHALQHQPPRSPSGNAQVEKEVELIESSLLDTKVAVLVRSDAASAAALVQRCFPSKHSAVLSNLATEPKLQFIYVRALVRSLHPQYEKLQQQREQRARAVFPSFFSVNIHCVPGLEFSAISQSPFSSPFIHSPVSYPVLLPAEHSCFHKHVSVAQEKREQRLRETAKKHLKRHDLLTQHGISSSSEDQERIQSIPSSFHIIFIEGACKYSQKEVLGHVSSYQEDFDIDEVLELCKDHQVHDAAAHLLERTGDSEGALNLTLLALGGAMKGLEEFVRHHWESFGDVAPAEKEKAVDLAKFGGWKIVKSIPAQRLEAVTKIIRMATNICSRNLDGEGLWFSLLDCFIKMYRSHKKRGSSEAAASAPLENKQENVFELVVEAIVAYLLDQVLVSVLENVPLPTVMKKIVEEHLGDELREFRGTLRGILTTYNYEAEILRSTNSMLSKDLQGLATTSRKQASKAFRASLLCAFCGADLLGTKVGAAQGFRFQTSRSAIAESIAIFNCGHSFHDKCLGRNQAKCPQCSKSSHSAQKGNVSEASKASGGSFEKNANVASTSSTAMDELFQSSSWRQKSESPIKRFEKLATAMDTSLDLQLAPRNTSIIRRKRSKATSKPGSKPTPERSFKLRQPMEQLEQGRHRLSDLEKADTPNSPSKKIKYSSKSKASANASSSLLHHHL